MYIISLNYSGEKVGFPLNTVRLSCLEKTPAQDHHNTSLRPKNPELHLPVGWQPSHNAGIGNLLDQRSATPIRPATVVSPP